MAVRLPFQQMAKRGSAPVGKKKSGGGAKRPRMVVYAKQPLINRLGEVARADGFDDTGPWLLALALRRMRRRGEGAKSFGALRDEREDLIRRFRRVFEEIEAEHDAEELSALSAKPDDAGDAES